MARESERDARREFGDRPPLRDTLTGGRPPGRENPDPLLGGAWHFKMHKRAEMRQECPWRKLDIWGERYFMHVKY